MEPRTPTEEDIKTINTKPEILVAKADIPVTIKPGLAKTISYKIFKSVTRPGAEPIENLEAYCTRVALNEIEVVKKRLKTKELKAKKTTPAKTVAEKSEPNRTDELKNLDSKSSPKKEVSKDVPRQSPTR